MPQIPNKLMPVLQFIAALLILVLFAFIAVGPMLSLHEADKEMKETLKAIILIVIGFLFGSAVGSAKKDDLNAALTAQIVTATPPAATIPPEPPQSPTPTDAKASEGVVSIPPTA